MTHDSRVTDKGPQDAVRACGALDIGDEAAVLPTDVVAPGLRRAAMEQALTSARFDGDAENTKAADGVCFGKRTVAKAQHRVHERLDVLVDFEALRRSVGLPAPALLDHGVVDVDGVSTWWIVMERAEGEHGNESLQLLPGRQHALAQVLRKWHDHGDATVGPRLDDPGVAGLFFGEIRGRAPLAAKHLAAELDTACRDARMAAIHGDAAVGHNVLFKGDDVAAVLDPGAVRVAPPMLCLGWAAAVDIGFGGTYDAAVAGYGPDAADRQLLDRLLPLLVTRRLADVRRLGDSRSESHLGTWLAARRPDLLELAIAGSGFGRHDPRSGPH